MATGDQNDMVARLRADLPPQWFPNDAVDSPVLTMLLQAPASSAAHIYSLTQYAELQTRISTASDGWLDLIAFDYFEDRITRNVNESDAAFRARIKLEILRERATRHGLYQVLLDLTGIAPVIFEPWRPADAFCLNSSALGVGELGSRSLPAQTFVIAYRPVGSQSGLSQIAGLGSNYAGLGSGFMALTGAAIGSSAVTDAAIYAAVESVRAAGTTIWVQITNVGS